MKFIFADSLDFVDPNYDFLRDELSPNRDRYWDDVFPHELFKSPPYDGLLVSRAIVGDHIVSGKYSESQAMRLRRVGAREFLRFNSKKVKDYPVIADCGAFSYAHFDFPPYAIADTMEFYQDGQFTHGCSVDHVIFDFYSKNLPIDSVDPAIQQRYEITLANAEEFITECKREKSSFTPIGIVQGWSPDSMASATKSLQKMGYNYIALGGLVPLASDTIKKVLDSVCPTLPTDNSVRLHILGFAKAGLLEGFQKYPIYSFDTTSPLIRAFKDQKQNYYHLTKSNEMQFYTAVRIPPSDGHSVQRQLIKTGRETLEKVVKLEKKALTALRNYDKNSTMLEEALDAVAEYSRMTLWSEKRSTTKNEIFLEQCLERYKTTLEDKPWKLCKCDICRDVGIEVIIFRGSNRNKRRGFHNLYTYNKYLKSVINNK